MSPAYDTEADRKVCFCSYNRVLMLQFWEELPEVALAALKPQSTSNCGFFKLNTHKLYLRIIWRVVLYNPIYFWDIQTSSSNIGAQKNTRFRVAELKEGLCPFFLLLFPLPKVSTFQTNHLTCKANTGMSM